MSGRHRSPHRGVSVEFVERRPYVQGDDLRHLDWKAYARTNRLVIKRYEEETNLEATLVVDASASMAYPETGTTKYDYACQAAAALAYLVLRERDGAAMALFDTQVGSVVASSTATDHIQPIVARLVERRPAGETELGTTLGKLAERFPRPGIVVVVSDLLGDLADLAHGLDQLCARRNDVIVLHVMHADEVAFPFDRITRFEGMEEDARLLVDAPALRDAYLAEFEAWRAEVRRACHVRGVDYAFLDTDTPIEVALSAYLAHRMNRLGVVR